MADESQPCHNLTIRPMAATYSIDTGPQASPNLTTFMNDLENGLVKPSQQNGPPQMASNILYYGFGPNGTQPQMHQISEANQSSALQAPVKQSSKDCTPEIASTFLAPGTDIPTNQLQPPAGPLCTRGPCSSTVPNCTPAPPLPSGDITAITVNPQTADQPSLLDPVTRVPCPTRDPPPFDFRPEDWIIPDVCECMTINFIEISIKCPLCKSIRHQFRLLNCMHYFCTNCMVAIVGDSKPGTKLVCPECQETELVKPNRAYDHIVPQFLHTMHYYYNTIMTQNTPPCFNSCEPEPNGAPEHSRSNYKCVTCNRFFCEPCKEVHKKCNCSHEMKHYTQALLDDLKYKVRESGTKCPMHQGQQYTYHCIQCSLPLCNECSMRDHAWHPKNKIHSFHAIDRNKEIDASTQRIRNALISLKDIAMERKKYKIDLFEYFAFSNEQITLRSKTRHEMVEHWRRSYTRHVNISNTKHDAVYFEEINTLNKMMETFQLLYVKFRTFTSIALDEEMNIMCEDVEKMVEMYCEMVMVRPVLLSEEMAIVDSVPNPTLDLQVGKSKLIWFIKHFFQDHNLKSENITVNQELIAVTSHNENFGAIVPVGPEINLIYQWADLMKRKDIFYFPCRSSFVRWGNVEALAVVNRRMEVQGEPDMCDIVLINPHLSCGNVLTVPLDPWVRPYGICAAQEEGIFYTDCELGKLPSIHYTGVYTAPRLVWECNPCNKILLAPSHLCVSKYNEIILTCTLTQNVVIITQEGEIVHVNTDFHCTHPGLHTIGGVCTDAEGFIYVANFMGNAIYKLDQTGKTMGPVLTADDGCMFPTDVEIFDNKLFVTSDLGLKVFTLKQN